MCTEIYETGHRLWSAHDKEGYLLSERTALREAKGR